MRGTTNLWKEYSEFKNKYKQFEWLIVMPKVRFPNVEVIYSKNKMIGKCFLMEFMNSNLSEMLMHEVEAGVNHIENNNNY